MLIKQIKINKPWGHEILWSSCQKFVGKILFIKEESKLSRQYHKIKEETILVLEGTLKLEIDTGPNLKSIRLEKGQSFHIVPGVVHRFCANYGDVTLAEVSTPELDDVIRLEDDYGRVK